MINADSKTIESLSPELFNNRFDSIVTAATAVLPDPQTTWFQIQIVMHDHHGLGRQTKFAKETFEGGTAEIHPVERTGQLD